MFIEPIRHLEGWNAENIIKPKDSNHSNDLYSIPHSILHLVPIYFVIAHRLYKGAV